MPERLQRLIEQERILRALHTYWVQNPELRLGQVICNASRRMDPYYITDKVILERLLDGE